MTDTSPTTATGPAFLERQSIIDQPIVPAVAVLVIVVFAIFSPGWLMAVIAVIWIAFIWAVRLSVSVDAAGVSIRYRPVAKRQIPLAEIAEVKVVKYRPIKDFGGWGPRTGRGGVRCFTLSGTDGVELKLTGGDTVLIGSNMPAGLVGAIERARSGS